MSASGKHKTNREGKKAELKPCKPKSKRNLQTKRSYIMEIEIGRRAQGMKYDFEKATTKENERERIETHTHRVRE